MTTHDYELLDQPPNELGQVIRHYPGTVKSLEGNVLTAMLGWLQGKDSDVYDICVNEIWRRRESDYVSLDERIGNVDYADAARRSRTATWGLSPAGETNAAGVAGLRVIRSTPDADIAEHLRAEQTVYTSSGDTNTKVTVDLCELVIELRFKGPDGATHIFNSDVPNTYRLGRSLVEAAERLSDFCAHGSYGEDTDPRHLLPAES